MKKRYRIIAITLVLVLLLTGCDIVAAPTVPTTTEEPIPSQSTQGTTAPDEPDIYIRYIPEEVENPDDLPVLKWVCLTQWRYGLAGNRAVNEEAMREVNQMLADRDMPFRLQVITISDLEPNLTPRDWFSVPEAQELLKDADLIYGYMRWDDMQEYCAPITEYAIADAEPTLKGTAFHELDWLRTTVDGEIYGIPLALDYPGCSGWTVNPELFQKYGLTEADFQKNYWEMDEVFAKIYEQNGNEPFLYEPGDSCSTYTVPYLEYPAFFPLAIYDSIFDLHQTIGYCFAIDRSSGSPKVVNLYDMDSVRAAWAAYMRYKNAGYTDELTRAELESGDRSRIKVGYGSLKASWVHTTQWGDTHEYISIPASEVVLGTTFAENFMNGVAAVSQHKEEAIQLLNLIAEDEEFRMRLLFGKEGRDYEIKDGYYKIIEQDDGSYYSMNVLSPLSFFSGLTAEESDSSSSTLSCGTNGSLYVTQEGKTKQESRLENLNSIDYFHYPVVFDYSGFEKELSAIEAVCRGYFSYFTNNGAEGQEGKTESKPVMTESKYDQMLQEFKDAGSEKIIAELQRQLDAWLAENPDWLAQYD